MNAAGSRAHRRGVVDVQRDGGRSGLGADAVDVDHSVGQAYYLAQGGRVLPVRHRRLRAQIIAAVGQPPASEIEAWVDTEVIEVVAVLRSRKRWPGSGRAGCRRCRASPTTGCAAPRSAGKAVAQCGRVDRMASTPNPRRDQHVTRRPASVMNKSGQTGDMDRARGTRRCGSLHPNRHSNRATAVQRSAPPCSPAGSVSASARQRSKVATLTPTSRETTSTANSSAAEGAPLQASCRFVHTEPIASSLAPRVPTLSGRRLLRHRGSAVRRQRLLVADLHHVDVSIAPVASTVRPASVGSTQAQFLPIPLSRTV